MKIKDIRNMTNEELNAKLASTKAELFNLRFQHATGNLANPMLLNTLKKDIAKIKTVLTEREMNINSDKKAKA
jgi:large subunit ribosomal protein L29